MYLTKPVNPIDVPQFQWPIYSIVTDDSLVINATTSLTSTRLWLDEFHSSKLADCLPVTTETKHMLNASNDDLI